MNGKKNTNTLNTEGSGQEIATPGSKFQKDIAFKIAVDPHSKESESLEFFGCITLWYLVTLLHSSE